MRPLQLLWLVPLLAACPKEDHPVMTVASLYEADLACWHSEPIPEVPYCYECYTVTVDAYGRCWRILSAIRPEGEGWGEAPVSIDEACPERGRDGFPLCMDVLGYEAGWPYDEDE